MLYLYTEHMLQMTYVNLSLTETRKLLQDTLDLLSSNASVFVGRR